MLRFIKVLDYDRHPPGQDQFDFLAGVTDHSIDPLSSHPGELGLNANLVLLSPLQRAQGCVQRQPDTEYRTLPELREVPFNLPKLCSREEWALHGSAIIRQRFVEAFTADQLLISRADILRELQRVFRLCLEMSVDVGIAAISHSFRMKIAEALTATHGKLVKNPSLLGDFITPDERTYAFGEGFNLNREDIAAAINW